MVKVTTKQSNNIDKPVKNLSKVTKKQREKKENKSDRMAEMVIDAFERWPNEEGITLRGIKKHIATTFYVEMTKANQTIIKKFLGKEFREGRLSMTNDDGDKLNYAKRFVMVGPEVMQFSDSDTEQEE